jgi:hypothetical protein
VRPGLSQSRWLFGCIGLTPAAPPRKRGQAWLKKEIFGVWLVSCAHEPRIKPLSVKLLCESRAGEGQFKKKPDIK